MIAFLITTLNVRGGTHKQLLKLIEYTESQGEDFIIITEPVDWNRTYVGFQKYKDKIRPIFFKPSKHVFSKVFNTIKRISILRKLVKDASVINIHDSGFETFLPAFMGKVVVWQINDLPYYFHVGVSKGKTTFQDFLRKKYFLFFQKYITAYTVNVSKNQERIKNAFHRDAKVFYCGIEPVEVNRNIDDTTLRFKDKKINLLSSGVFFPYRNYETQISVVKSLVERGIDANLNIIGTTKFNVAYANKIQQLITEAGLEKRITICGEVDEIEFKRLHKNADVFMFINIDQSWGLAVFEAMSCGLPVIVSNSVGATEILQDKENSIFVDPINVEQIVNEIIRLMSDDAWYKKISLSAASFHKDYTWDRAYSSKMLNLMNSLKTKK